MVSPDVATTDVTAASTVRVDRSAGRTRGASIYTRTGDGGETDLADGPRVPKNSARLEVCGDFDELNSWLGLIRCEPLPNDIVKLLECIQRRLFDLGGELVTVAAGPGQNAIGPRDVEALEQVVDRCEAALKPLDLFLLPGGTRAASMLHVARAVCRRAERNLVTLLNAERAAVSPALHAYVNRLSDLLFVLARTANHRAGVGETTW
jgi:cob(I)alamin adenosyltransferase